MTSLRPYLIRAHHEWMSDNGLTPHLVVNANHEDVQVPASFVQDGTIVLNISLRAVRDLMLRNESIEFSARFSGVPHQIYVPLAAVRGLVAREYGIGITFPDEQGGSPAEAVDDIELAAVESADDEPPPDPPRPGGGGQRPSLRVVK
ncbi:MAG: ClpXP protease specificity-enhancing factor [Pseudomonadota bacterium]